ncbi:gastrula zinc finger protein xFG20-1-like [Physella acuta]|uniref:gastrula zinc finger protein xFG20-1-like n=1 Tax=Physella acuta TaxID=109671 RepID=UPI0027DE13CB|nr:gastrula zinc finger protein xFG20-1-like [Physella acuta]
MNLPTPCLYLSGLEDQEEHSSLNLIAGESSSTFFDILSTVSSDHSFHASLLADIDLDLECEDDDNEDSTKTFESVKTIYNFIPKCPALLFEEGKKPEATTCLTTQTPRVDVRSHAIYGNNVYFRVSFPENNLKTAEPNKSCVNVSKLIACTKCNFQFSTQKAYMHHYADKHIAKKENVMHVCSVCAESFKYKKSLIQHSKSHNFKSATNSNIPNLFSCAMCEYIGKTRKLLKYHMRARHASSRKKYSCESCNFVCLQKRSLVLHLQKHEEDPKFACDQCGKLFHSMCVLKRHAHTHRKIKSYPCTVGRCDKQFTIRSRLTDHIRAVHGKGLLKRGADVYRNSQDNDRAHCDMVEVSDQVSVSKVNSQVNGSLQEINNQVESFLKKFKKLQNNSSQSKSHDDSNPSGPYDNSSPSRLQDDSGVIRPHDNSRLTLSHEKSSSSRLQDDSGVIRPHDNSRLTLPHEISSSSTSHEIPLKDIFVYDVFLEEKKMDQNSPNVTNVKEQLEGKTCSLPEKTVLSSTQDQVGHKERKCSKFVCTWEGCGKSFRDNYNLRVHTFTHRGDMQRTCPWCRYRCIQKAALDTHIKTHRKC